MMHKKPESDYGIVKVGALVLPTSDAHRASKLVRLAETTSGTRAAFESLLARSSRERKLSALQPVAGPPIRRRRTAPPVPPLVVIVPRSGLMITGGRLEPEE